MSAQVEQTLEVIVLAAGKGRRMYSALPKVLHELAGEPLLGHVFRRVKRLRPQAIHVVYGHGGDAVRARFEQKETVNWIMQEEQQGTGHAVKTALPSLHPGATALIVYGDVPLVDCGDLTELIDSADVGKLALMTARLKDPQGYGRVLRGQDGKVMAIVEQNDANTEQSKINEINTGFLAASVCDLARWLEQVTDNNAQKEYYLTDVVSVAVAEGCAIADVQAADAMSVQGVNSKIELAQLERRYQRQRAEFFLQQGVTIIDPGRIDVRGEVRFGRDCIVDVNVVLQGPLEIGDEVRIGANSIVCRSQIGNRAHIKSHSVIDQAALGEGTVVGPFARVRPGAKTAADVKIGNFVEIKNSELGAGTKVNHLSYVGDSMVGRNVNIGAGVITCNYDGVEKHHTHIGNEVFVGSNSQLIAPVELGDGVTIGAGSTITDNVPAHNLAVGRARQKNVQGWQRGARKKT